MEHRKRYVIPKWCKDICVNSGNVACTHYCAKNREAEYFLPNDRPMPEFPYGQWRWDMSVSERQAVVGYYLTKIVEALTDQKDESLDAQSDNLTDGQIFEMIVERGLLIRLFDMGEGEEG